MTDHRVSYTLDSTLETVDSTEQAASRIAAESGFDEDEVMQISMAVREAAVNAVLHGNAYDPGKKVSVDFERTGRRIGCPSPPVSRSDNEGIANHCQDYTSLR